MKLSDERLKEIRERAEKATPGPWTTVKLELDKDGWSRGVCIAATAASAGNRVYATPLGGFPSSDQNFIAHARTDIPDLLGALEEARAELRELRERERWIPCSEKLPEKLDAVLVAVGNAIELSWREGRWGKWHKYGKDYDVHHWRPLPLPPEEEKNG